MTQSPPATDPTLTPPSPASGSSALAVTSLCLGIAGLVICILGPVFGIAAVITGAIALSRKRPGRGMAIGGVVCGSLAALLGFVIVPLVLFGSLSQARQVARMTQSMTNCHAIGSGLMMYTADYKDQLPEQNADLRARLASYTDGPKVFESPNDRSAQPGYIYLGHGKISKMDPAYVLVYENLNVPALRYAVLFVDGHVEAKTKEEIEALIARQQTQPSPASH